MSAYKDAMRFVADKLRAMRVTPLGLDTFAVVMRVVTWSGERPGVGTKTTTDTTLTLDGSNTVRVRKLTARDIIASGNLYAEGDFRIGPFTPQYSINGGGGVPTNYFNPAVVSPSTEVFFKITGPGFESGAWFRKVDQDTDKPLQLNFVIRAANVQSP